MYPNPPNPPHPPYPPGPPYGHPPQPPPKKGLSTGATVGIILGSVGVVVIALVIYIGVKAGSTFKKFTKKAKNSEATLNLFRIQSRAEQYKLEMGQYPLAPEAVVAPALGTCCNRGSMGKCPPDPSLWEGPPWDALRFSVDDPHYFYYSYQSDGTGFTARAYGDLDCDGTMSTFTVTNDQVSTTSENELE
jgi:type II secretory pathway pseudopilin PulG